MDKYRTIYKKLFKAYGKQYWWPVTSSNKKFEIMIGSILTQNTSWLNVEKAIKNLKKNDLIDPEKIKEIRLRKLAGLIRSSGYYNQKAKKLKKFSNYFLKRYDGKVKKMSKEDLTILRFQLLNVYGIGPETADSILLYALNKPIFVIDAYTKRIMLRIGLVKRNISYDKLQEQFMDALYDSAKMFNEYHALLVFLGKSVCKTKPLCNKCPLKGLCMHYKRYRN